MIHFTHTGYYAGVVMCGAPKDHEATTTPYNGANIPPYVHPGYGLFAKDDKIRELVKAGIVCPDCADIWLNADQEG